MAVGGEGAKDGNPASSVDLLPDVTAEAKAVDLEQVPTLPKEPKPTFLENGRPAPLASPASAPSASDLSGGRGGTASPRPGAQQLRQEEAARARAFSGTALAGCALVVVEELVFDDSPGAEVLTLVAFVALAVAAVFTWRLTAEPRKYTRQVARLLAAASLAATLAFTYRLGVFSPAPIFALLAVAFFGLGEDRVVAYGFTVGSGLGYLGLVWLIFRRAIPDPGVVHALDASPAARLSVTTLVPLALAAALWHARLGRRATLNAIARSNDWLREVRQRDVQLSEANRDLDKLLKMNAGESPAHIGARAGPYLLHERIGRGAMGEVYAARHVGTGAVAAVKLLNPDMQHDELLMQRFLREGEAASKLRAPNVVELYEVGKLEDGAPYFAMELLRGHDLHYHLRRRGRLPLEEAIPLVEQVGAGLEAARLAGVVHRDLKPQNLFLAQQTNAAPIWKILDFGVSRLTDSAGTLTQDIIVGTPGYMSPEQAGGAVTTHRSDIFSFGSVLYRTLTGEAPFSAEDTPQTLYKVVFRNPHRPSALATSLPPDVDLVLAIALAKDPEDRFESAPELAAAMRAAAKNALDPQKRLHARTLLAALPWGSGARDSGAEVDEEELSLSDAEPIELP